ncbi:MAG: YkgJ family cysteine cluster protein [Candidatus Methanomethylicia archaeon]
MPIKCIKCGKCCIETEMPLTMRDMERIMKLGYDKSEFTTIVNGKHRLRNMNGHCYFLDPKRMKCKIYEYRPEGCRIYPVICVEGGYINVDDECPASRFITIREIYHMKPRLIRLLMEVEK